MKNCPLLFRYRSIFVLLCLLFLAGCATNERVDFPINPSTDNQKLFDCTILAIEQHNQEIPALIRSPKNPYHPKGFRSDIAQKNHIQRGIFHFENQTKSYYQYPLHLYRTKINISLKSSTTLSQDLYLRASLITLSEKIQECLPEIETMSTTKKHQ